jgi:Transposase IS66 family
LPPIAAVSKGSWSGCARARNPTDAEGRKLRDAVYLDCRDKLFVFLKRRDAEPTNNESKRALRPSVIFRKVTSGFRSEWGARDYAALCSIVETGRRNGRSALYRHPRRPGHTRGRRSRRVIGARAASSGIFSVFDIELTSIVFKHHPAILVSQEVCVPARLTYHQPVLGLLGVEPVLPFDRLAVIEERERVCGVRFPASVREWFAVQGAEALFHDNTNEDDLEKLEELGDSAETRQGYLRVATENQSVVAWYVRLDEGDDPPVYHNNDEWNEDLSKTNWQESSVTFTNFIFDMISSDCFDGWLSGLHWSAKDSMPDEATLDRLRGWFQQGSTTDVSGLKIYRFFTTQGVIAIRSEGPDDFANGTAEWSIDAASREALLDFGRKLWDVGTLAQTLKAESCSPISRAEGERLLWRLRLDQLTKRGE